MKKFAIITVLAMFVSGSVAAMFVPEDTPSASAVSETQLTAGAAASGTQLDYANSMPAQLLTVTCGQRKGDLMFSDAELNRLVDTTTSNPDMTTKVCSVFTMRVKA